MAASDLNLAAVVGDHFAGWSPQMLDQLQRMFTSNQFMPFVDALARVGNCAHPIRLRGSSTRIDPATGEILSSYASSDEPLGVTYIRCGNRRASVCPACSRVYAADVFHLIRAGVTGGKTVPESVAENPLVFATLTAPSFGHVHSAQACGRPVRGTRHCRHGHTLHCLVRHGNELGQPLCFDCYDYTSQVVWQWWAPDLWRRFTIALRRLLAKTLGVPGDRAAHVATVQYAKVAEYQRRGVVHFHALIRLDGPRTPEGFAAAPARIDSRRLARLVQAAAQAVRLTVPGIDGDDPARTLAFGSSSTSDRSGSAAAPTIRPRRSCRSRWLAIWRSTPRNPLTTLDLAVPPTPTSSTRRSVSWAAGLDSPCSLPRRRRGVSAARQVGAHARLPRPLRLQVAPVRDHPRRPSPSPAPRQHAHRRNPRERPAARPGRA